jgi:hypothetical protein
MASSGSKQTCAHSSASQPAGCSGRATSSLLAYCMLTAVNGSCWMDNISLWQPQPQQQHRQSYHCLHAWQQSSNPKWGGSANYKMNTIASYDAFF